MKFIISNNPPKMVSERRIFRVNYCLIAATNRMGAISLWRREHLTELRWHTSECSSRLVIHFPDNYAYTCEFLAEHLKSGGIFAVQNGSGNHRWTNEAEAKHIRTVAWGIARSMRDWSAQS